MISLKIAAIFMLQSLPVQGGGSGGAKKHAGIVSPLLPAPIPVLTCPEGFEMEDGRCARHLIQPLVPVCPEGILQPDNTCLLIVPPGRNCPPDMVLVGGTCIRTTTAPAMLECPPDFQFEPGYKKSTSVCIKPIVLPPPMVCPPGSAPEGDLCLVENIIMPALSCPAETILTGNACMKIERYECNKMVGLIGGKKARWLEGIDRDDEIVVYDGPVDLAYDDMFDLDIFDTVGDELADPRQLGGRKGHKYPQNYVEIAVVGQQCEQRSLIPPIMNCPEGSTLIGRECITSTTVTRTAGAPLMSVETIPPLQICPSGFAKCGGAHKTKRTGHDCCAVEEAPFALGCPAAFNLVNDICQSFRPAEYVCTQPGFVKHKHKSECISVEYHVPVVA
eukprot:Blabericola_migrator_1__701@NODE_1174_length_5213_cov_40_985037_g798_i0_p1_GENE_NODE_1174_length_5213_cov_40_985037_g798_i0NODE_1174_length_5213_cov_40_985037_g798_i0_p1_ORF_typecomplete_len390_score49_48_NODE_1174_length_5213_cov_40_985037_g798_i028434012